MDMENQLDTFIIFSDIKEIVSEFKATRTPKKVRRLISEFLTQTKQLTDIMRKEYSSEIGLKWTAMEFEEWDEVSSFFYSLRNIHIHEAVARIQVKETSIFTLAIEGYSPQDLRVTGTAKLLDQCNNEVPKGLKLALDPEGKEVILPHTYTYSYEIDTTYKEVEKLVNKLKEHDLHNLVEHYFNTLSAYYDFYINKLEENRFKK
jgi:hypothetical protein